MLREITAPEQTIRVGKCFVGFFAIKKNEFYFPGEVRPLGQDARELEQGAGARAAVIRPDKAGRVECLGVVVRTDEKRRLAFFRRKGGDKIYKLDFAARCFVGKNLAFHFPSGRFELGRQKLSRLLNCFCSRRPRTEVHYRLDVSERFLAGKIFPDFFLRASLRLGVGAVACGEKTEQSTRNNEHRARSARST